MVDDVEGLFEVDKQGTNRALIIESLDKDFGPLPPIVCLFPLSDFTPFLSLMHVYGKIYLLTLITPSPSLLMHL